ncbi:MAG: YesL family protein [Clostridiales bacterium]|nr:YesL family protein [Clostridiales bacterium]
MIAIGLLFHSGRAARGDKKESPGETVRTGGFGSVWEILNAIGQMVVASILWAVCCLPVVTIGPACAALYYTVVKVIRRDRSTVTEAFFHSLKENFRQGLYINLIFLTIGAAVSLIALPHIGSWLNDHSPDTALYVSAGLFLMFVWMLPYIYPVLSRFCYSNLRVFQFVVLIGVRYFYITILLLALLAAAVFFTVNNPVFLIIIPALYDFIASLLLEPIFRKYSLADDHGHFDLWYAKDESQPPK